MVLLLVHEAQTARKVLTVLREQSEKFLSVHAVQPARKVLTVLRVTRVPQAFKVQEVLTQEFKVHAVRKATRVPQVHREHVALPVLKEDVVLTDLRAQQDCRVPPVLPE